MFDIYSAKEAYKASQSMRDMAVEKELTVAMQAIKGAVQKGTFHCLTACMSVQAKDALTSAGYEVDYNRDGNDGDTCTISWLNADK